MSTPGYDDDYGEHTNILLNNWRGAVLSAVRGKRGKPFCARSRQRSLTK